jgi:hypothetical protein
VLSSVIVVLVVIKHRINTSKIKLNQFFYYINFFLNSENYREANVFDSSPTGYDNKNHVSEIYGIGMF